MNDKKSPPVGTDVPTIDQGGTRVSGWSNSPADRNERARRIREHRAFERETRRDQFLQEWLKKAEASQRWFESESFTRDELQEMAEQDGYRTAAAWLAVRKQSLQTLHRFVHEDAFKRLWAILREYDKKKLSTIPSYSPGRGSVPSLLLSAIQHWHQAPKLTATERSQLSQKIAATCEVLEGLLAQVSPSHEYDDQYERFRFDDATQARAAFRVFGADTRDADADPFFGVTWRASVNLRACGVVPLWAVGNIKRMALTQPRSANTLPTKMRAKTAQRTFFIGAVHHAIDRAALTTPSDCGIDRQLMAEIVGLLTDTDCTADDVRKAAPRSNPED